MICASALGVCGLAVWADDCIRGDKHAAAMPVAATTAAPNETTKEVALAPAIPEPADPEPTKVLDLVSAPQATPVNPPVAPPVVPPEQPPVLRTGASAPEIQLPSEPPPPPPPLHLKESPKSEKITDAAPPPPLSTEPPPIPKHKASEVPPPAAIAELPPATHEAPKPIDLSPAAPPPPPAPVQPPVALPSAPAITPALDAVPAPAPVTPIPPAPLQPSARPHASPSMPPSESLAPTSAATAPLSPAKSYRLHMHMGGATGPHFEIYDGETCLLRVHCEQIELRREGDHAASSIVGQGKVRVSGSGISGTCDQLIVASSRGEVQLQGNVKLHCYRGGASSVIDANSMSFQLKGGTDVPNKTHSSTSGKVVPASGSQP
jgi:hypothetical protein